MKIETLHQRLLESEVFLQKGALKEAESILNELLEHSPSFGPAYNHMAWIHAQRQHFDQADAYYRKALDLSPEFPGTYFNYLVFLRNLRRFDEMEGVYERGHAVPGIRLDILNAEYGTGLEAAHRFQEAIEAYRNSIRHAFNEEDIKAFQAAVARCELKINLDN